MRILQLLNVDGESAGLYVTKRQDDIQKDVDDAFALGIQKEKEEDEYINVHEIADEYLEIAGVHRIFADKVITNAI